MNREDILYAARDLRDLRVELATDALSDAAKLEGIDAIAATLEALTWAVLALGTKEEER